MRAVGYSDVRAAARALLDVDTEMRARQCREMFREADIADRYTRRIGRMHPEWGRGTLYDAATRRGLAAERGFDDPDYCACFRFVLDQLCLRPRSLHM